LEDKMSQDTIEGREQTQQPASINNQPGPLYLNDAVRTPGEMNLADFIGFSRGRRSLDHSVWYSGWLMTFLATGEETQGQFALIEAVGRKGNVPPPHIHRREDEISYVLEGEMVVSVGDRTFRGTPGTMIFLPRDVRHSFTIESEQVRMLILLTPAGLEGWFKEFSVPALAMTLPPADEAGYHEVQRMLEAAPRYGLEHEFAG
jgi:quercetin dioxygenase-like cupin family protein